MPDKFEDLLDAIEIGFQCPSLPRELRKKHRQKRHDGSMAPWHALLASQIRFSRGRLDS